MENTGWNEFTHLREVKQLTEPIFMKLRLDRKRCTENTFTEFYENPSDGFVADTGSRTDGWMTSQHIFFFFTS